ncbi:hypothetical protein [Aliidiomarina quisquiliarum]|uniref:hypothetical protein n=1 Tax=Aliidiomarina quisquiliarum TaxID=2938947 RepID=UPI00208E58E5|nr:hypothetical protein [Aliidiomarina quisquiliarum]MCO4320955.1 hypothetical protein [Aliidiomarina quisquiliarum]
MYLATVDYQNPEGQSYQVVVGVFSSESKANYAIENFIEGVIYIEWSDAINIKQTVVKVELDQPIFE